VGTSLASVDNVEVLQRESELGRELVDSGSEVSFGKGSELVEEWLDWLLVDARLCGV
jgi:hypothetical protein